MTINQNNIIRNSGERGTYNKYDWKKEARSKRLSAIRLRELASHAYQNFLDEQSASVEQEVRMLSNRVFDLLGERESLNKDSFLLIGYAIELFE